MGQRFADLEKSVIAILANAGNPLTSSDERVRKYWEWKTNPSSTAHRLPAASKRTTDRKKDPRYILPFSLELAANQHAVVQVTKRTIAAAAAAAVTTLLGYKTLSATDKAIQIGRFKPAQVYWRKGAAAASAPRTSRITNQPYQSYYAAADEGFTASFGKSVAADTAAERQKAIGTVLTAIADVNLVSFTSEKYSG